MADPTRSWLGKFSVDHPWLASAAGAGLVGSVFGVLTALDRSAEDGLVGGGLFAVLLFLFLSVWWVRQARELRGEVPVRPRRLEGWAATHPWGYRTILAASLGMISVGASWLGGRPMSEAFLVGAALGGGLFLFSTLLGGLRRGPGGKPRRR